ncbi:hypothetical protein [Roseateles sp.]|uniref:lipopolysaccharide biosynthesis protein n=1 Tax=Roseateles sp. TaxID=1971397 RepID=UPI0031DCC2EB
MSALRSEHGRAQRLWRAAGLDFHVLATLLFRGWGILAGGVTTLLLPFWLSPAQQGFYYTFGSLLALQVFFELGLNQVIVQLVGHEAAHLQFHDDGTVSGDAARRARLQAIRRLVTRWYLVAAVLFAAVGGLAGHVFFERRAALPAPEWELAWFALVLTSAVNLFLSPRLAIIEGTGRVGQVARLRLIQSFVGYGAMWLLLIAGAGLWVAVAVPGVSSLVTLLWLRARGELRRREAVADDGRQPLISWRKDIFPLQWRIAVSWACGYFIFNLFTPIIFAHHGAREAGQFGMAMAIFNAATTVGLSWINAKTPAFTMHISRGESMALNGLFRAVTIRSTAFTGLLSFGFVGTVAIATAFAVPGLHRLASGWTLWWLAIATTINVLVYACASYMRAHREEPMVPVSIVSALCTVAVVLTTADAPIPLMMALYAGISALVTLPWTVMLLRRYRARHAVEAMAPPATTAQR